MADTNPRKKRYAKPVMISENLFESKALACGKLPTGGAGDCYIETGGMLPNSTS
ncbi:MAG: hypothetical protein L6Q71_00100 [Planctomycetes bacterium]|nr:hypothetical protein [Planctomycetota bacterium]NUQ34294.1 hypothetical protein [Planctomycetaceae bacterium]